MSFYLDLAPKDCIGRGTGVDDEGLKRKEKAITVARELHSDKTQPREILAAVVVEIAAIAGGMLKLRN